MIHNKDNLYHSILLRAADEWGVSFEDVERDIGNQFDPVVRFLAGACASELELVYKYMDRSEDRIQERLSKVLLPEYFHLPKPAHALATARPVSDAIEISETAVFATIDPDLDKEEIKEISLAPIFPVNLIPATIKVLATEDHLLELTNRKPMRALQKAGEKEWVSKILLGIEMEEPLPNWDGATLYFDLRGRSKDSGEKAAFFNSISNSSCFLDGKRMASKSGLPQKNLLVEDYLNGNERYEKEVRARYERHFITFGAHATEGIEPVAPPEFLPEWFAKVATSKREVELKKLNKQLQDPLYWLEIHLDKPVEIEHLMARLSVKLNVFPVANRQLCGNGNGEHIFMRSAIMRWVQIQPKEDFISIRRVYEERAPDYQEFLFKPFADFKEDKMPSYTLRYGGVGRWDEFNAWERLAYVISVLQSNYKHEDLINGAASAMSLEDVHHLLGKKIDSGKAIQKPTQNIYVLLHTGVKSGLRVRVEYWTSTGANGNGIAARTELKCRSKESAYLDKKSIVLITPTIDGADPLNRTQQLDAMKSALMSRGRIVTRQDIKSFIVEQLKEKLTSVSVRDGVGIDRRIPDAGMTRLIEVKIMPNAKFINEDWEAICQQLESLINQRSSSGVPIKVTIHQNRKSSVL